VYQCFLIQRLIAFAQRHSYEAAARDLDYSRNPPSTTCNGVTIPAKLGSLRPPVRGVRQIRMMALSEVEVLPVEQKAPARAGALVFKIWRALPVITAATA